MIRITGYFELSLRIRTEEVPEDKTEAIAAATPKNWLCVFAPFVMIAAPMIARTRQRNFGGVSFSPKRMTARIVTATGVMEFKRDAMDAPVSEIATWIHGEKVS